MTLIWCYLINKYFLQNYLEGEREGGKREKKRGEREEGMEGGRKKSRETEGRRE